ncbi:osteocalcin [Dunckerocampus dactyliophorus]|uniref:osteocalcin n=1 Tax=Dunckerocampus dactyliophorus TaxID=161453 RepID=UPI0024071F41|nr:osteocalcin [Dunckerocampus dactyliophorus]
MKTLAILLFCSLAVICLSSDSMDSQGDDDNNGRRNNYRLYDSYARHDNGYYDNGRRDNGYYDNGRRDNGHYDNGRRDNGYYDNNGRRDNGYYDSYNNGHHGVFVDQRQAAAVVQPRAAPRELTLTQVENLREVCESNVACEHMMGTSGVVAAYNAYYGAVPY